MLLGLASDELLHLGLDLIESTKCCSIKALKVLRASITSLDFGAGEGSSFISSSLSGWGSAIGGGTKTIIWGLKTK